MEQGFRARMLRGCALAGILLVPACSGGGGGGVNTTPSPIVTPAPTPAPSPTPSPTPTPTPTPPATNYDTTEYRASVGPVSMNALTAYQHGATGSGIVAAIIDSGIDLTSQEFGTRILSTSENTAGGSTVQDEGGHGTAVAFTLAGRRNGVGTQGVAFDASLFIVRADDPGSCAKKDSSGDPACTFSDSSIAAGVDAARQNGARVINISLGGSSPSSQLVQALTRATQAGIIIVVSAGNDGTDASKSANPDPFTSPATDASVSHGLIIIAGSVDSNDQLSDFSNRAGTSAAYYLAAVGEGVRAPDQTGTPYIWSGTSFSAPQIAGAVALLAQAFPNLSGTQIVNLLYSTARDAGAPGRDAIYGNGILDLTEAFKPQGTTSLAGSGATTSLDANATLSAPMGDAAQGTLGAVILDGYSRAYAVDLARTINHTGPARTLAGALDLNRRDFSASNGKVAVAVTIAQGQYRTAVERMSLRSDDADRARTLAASVVAQLDGKMRFAIGASQSGGVLTARLQGRSDPAFLVASDPTQSLGFDADVDGSAAIRRQLGKWGVSLAVESGNALTRRNALLPALDLRYDRYRYSRMMLGVDRDFGGLSTSATFNWLAENNSVLGAHFDGALGGAHGSTYFVDLAARYDAGNGWSLGVSTRQGWTHIGLSGGVGGGGTLRTNGYAFDVGKQGVFAPRDRFGLRFSQPLRVARGGIDLKLPTYWDYATSSVSDWSTQRLNLTPTERELVGELSYAMPWSDGTVSTNLFYRHNPGNFATLPDDKGAAVRFQLGF